MGRSCLWGRGAGRGLVRRVAVARAVRDTAVLVKVRWRGSNDAPGEGQVTRLLHDAADV